MSTTDDGQQQVSRPLLIVLAVVVGLAAIYALWVFVLSPLLSGDDDGTDTVQAPTPAPGATDTAPEDGSTPAPDDGATPAPTDGPDDLLGQPVPETFEIFPARDPFQQLVVQVAAGESGEAGAQVVDPDVPDDAATEEPQDPESEAPEAPTISDGDDEDDPAPPDEDDESDLNGDGPETQGGTQTLGADGAGEIYEPVDSPVGNTTISMTSVAVAPDGTESVAVSINDEPHEADEGEVFADRFQVLDIDGQCATYLFGDSRFTLCEGETITK